MAHLRERQLSKIFVKRLKYWPVIAILGPRQVGKSTFLRKLALPNKDFSYVTLDQGVQRVRANQNPESFLRSFEKWPIIIDEAQKAPALFDEIKSIVDEHRTPGRYILSGSSEFSKRTGIRESLTGRIAQIRMEPLTLIESVKKKSPSFSEVVRRVDQGGFPGVCFSRDKAVVSDYWEQWLDATCLRDVPLLSGGRLSGELAMRTVRFLACSGKDLPTDHLLSEFLGVDTRRIVRVVDLLRDLFIVREIEPHPKSFGKRVLFLIDSGLSSYLGAWPRVKLQTWFLSEWYAQRQIAGLPTVHPQYYQSRGGSFIDFVAENTLYLLCENDSPDWRQLRTIDAAKKVFPQHRVRIFCSTDSAAFAHSRGVIVHPWRDVGRVISLDK